LQPTSNFGRLYAIYGGFFIVLSYGWGWVVDGEKPDRGDFLGAGIAIVGVALAYFWPRDGSTQ
jgi:drug/metabolite transporter superfamily protein YnfA